jgi:haloacid dehalogenase superfamily, subfamily IA, variant 1 with third motif having Dx(3-4)D or Dx(3-4)E
MHKMELAVFDLDGTLTDSGQTIFKTTLKALKHIGIKDELKWDAFNKKIGAHFKEIFDELDVNVEDLEHFINVYKSFYFDFITDTSIYDGVLDTLKYLKTEGIKVALLTTKAQDQADLIIDYFGLREYFDMVTGRRAGHGIKPDPEPLLFICSELNVAANKTVMVGDSELDINCGKNAKAKTCAVSYGFRGKEALLAENPDWLINNMTDLKKII